MAKCQFGTANRSNACSTPATHRVLFDGDYVGRICADHREPFKKVYDSSIRVSFEPMRQATRTASGDQPSPSR